MSTQEWESKTIELTNGLIVEDGRAAPGDLECRALQLADDGWDLVALTATQRRFRRLKFQVHENPAGIASDVQRPMAP